MRLSLFAWTARVAVSSIYLTVVVTAHDTANTLALPYAAAVAIVAANDYRKMRKAR